jgi:serine/threonine-protein kinase
VPDLLDRLKAALADRYRVDREIGRGGMARVFLAHDLKLDRSVALKVLRPDLAAVIGRERFRREIQLAATLDHPYILGIHDDGEADGILYYVMPYVPGESLRDRLTREKQLPLDDALQITREVADALSYAHSRGIIHRDIKPENILLRAGHVAVADFGIARAIDEAGGEKLTATGIALGTPEYMSPEQAAGSRDLDGRSDVYSLGCVLYEMLAGDPPFTGPAERVVGQHLTAEPRAITQLRRSVPPHVAAALNRALAKTPADRFTTAALFGRAIAAEPVIAEVEGSVGPGSKTWVGWAAGLLLAAALVTSLVIWGPLGGLRRDEGDGGLPAPRPWVIVADFEGTADLSYRRAARDLVGTVLDQSTAAATFPLEQMRRGLELAGKPDTTTVTEAVARELAVRGSIGSVVTGQVDRVGSSYSVLLRLVRAANGEVLAAENRTAVGDDALIPTIEGAVRTLRVRLGEHRASLEAGALIAEAMTPSFAAYQKFAEGWRLEYVDGQNEVARALYRQALALDSGFVWVRLMLAGDWLSDSGRAVWEEALRHPERLTVGQRLNMEAWMAYRRWHLQVALRASEQWVRERPNDFRAWNVLGVVLFVLRGPDAYLEILDHAARLDPFKTTLLARNRTITLIVAGRRAEARQAAHGISNEAIRLEMVLHAAGLDGAWAEVDSLGSTWERAYLAEYGRAATNGTWRRTLHLVRGEVRAAAAETERPDRGSKLSLLGELAVGLPVTRADTGWEGAFEAALAGDTTAARTALPELMADSLDYRVQSGYWPAAIEAAVAARRGDWRTVLHRSGPLLRDRPALGPVIGPSMRWLAAHAHERLDRLDSAVALLGELVEPGQLDTRPYVASLPYAAANSYLRQHLIVLLAGLGRVEEARRHWEVFRAAFTNPDSEYAPLIGEAQVALEAAETKLRGR